MFSKPKRVGFNGQEFLFRDREGKVKALEAKEGAEALLFPFPEKRVELLIDEDLYRLDVGEADGFGGLSEEERKNYLKWKDLSSQGLSVYRYHKRTGQLFLFNLDPETRKAYEVALKNRRISGVKPWLFHIYDSLRGRLSPLSLLVIGEGSLSFFLAIDKEGPFFYRKKNHLSLEEVEEETETTLNFLEQRFHISLERVFTNLPFASREVEALPADLWEGSI